MLNIKYTCPSCGHEVSTLTDDLDSIIVVDPHSPDIEFIECPACGHLINIMCPSSFNVLINGEEYLISSDEYELYLKGKDTQYRRYLEVLKEIDNEH